MGDFAEQWNHREPKRKAVAGQNNEFTYKDYLEWTDEERWQLIDGVAYCMTPAPSRRHQEILGDLHRQFANYLMAKGCKVYIAPFDVRFPEKGLKDEEIKTVVQPDLLVVCDKSKLDDKGCIGAPDFIIEIVSPSTASSDFIKKLDLYERQGVKEYWIVLPVDNIAMAYLLNENGQYGRAKTYAVGDTIRVSVLDDCLIDLSTVFAE